MADPKNEIDDMLSGFVDPPVEEPSVDPPVVDPPVVDPPVEDPPIVVDPPVEDPVVVDPPIEDLPVEDPPIIDPPVVSVVDPPVVVPPVEETPEQRAVRIEAQNTALLARIETLSGAAPAPAATPTAPVAPVAPAPVAPVPAQAIEVEEVDFLQGQKPDDLIDDPTAFNKLLNVVYRKGVEAGVPLAMERSLLAVPQVVVSQIQRSNTMKGLVDDFYKVNEDLKPVQRTVGLVANEVHSENSDWTVQQVFDEAAVRTRKVLGMPDKSVAPVVPAVPTVGATITPKTDDPAFVNVRGSRQRGPAAAKLTGIAKEIDDLMI